MPHSKILDCNKSLWYIINDDLVCIIWLWIFLFFGQCTDTWIDLCHPQMPVWSLFQEIIDISKLVWLLLRQLCNLICFSIPPNVFNGGIMFSSFFGGNKWDRNMLKDMKWTPFTLKNIDSGLDVRSSTSARKKFHHSWCGHSCLLIVSKHGKVQNVELLRRHPAVDEASAVLDAIYDQIGREQ